MSAVTAATKRWTVEEYLAREATSMEKHEYLDGGIFLMAGASLEHNLVAAGLLSKASIMALPAVLVLLDVYPLRREAFTWPRLVAEKAGHWIVGAGGALGALVALEVSGLRITSYGVYGPAARTAMVAYSFWFYPAAWAWPVRLSPLYELPPSVDQLPAPRPEAGQLLAAGGGRHRRPP